MEEKLNTIQSLIGVLNSPIAQRKGVTISPEHCKIWVEELSKFMQESGWHPGSEHPVLEEDGTVVVISIHKDPKGMKHVGRAQCSKMGDKYYWDERNEWWCYPPEETTK